MGVAARRSCEPPSKVAWPPTARMARVGSVCELLIDMSIEPPWPRNRSPLICVCGLASCRWPVFEAMVRLLVPIKLPSKSTLPLTFTAVISAMPPRMVPPFQFSTTRPSPTIADAPPSISPAL
ncbi:hypothetical protein FQZ97_902810 [compost metagenome]